VLLLARSRPCLAQRYDKSRQRNAQWCNFVGTIVMAQAGPGRILLTARPGDLGPGPLLTGGRSRSRPCWTRWAALLAGGGRGARRRWPPRPRPVAAAARPPGSGPASGSLTVTRSYSEPSQWASESIMNPAARRLRLSPAASLSLAVRYRVPVPGSQPGRLSKSLPVSRSDGLRLQSPAARRWQVPGPPAPDSVSLPVSHRDGPGRTRGTESRFSVPLNVAS
jgi:hypothetical protein